MGATRIGWRLLATGLLGLVCMGCMPTLALRDLSMDEPRHDSSNGVAERGARLPQTTGTNGKLGLAEPAAVRAVKGVGERGARLPQTVGTNGKPRLAEVAAVRAVEGADGLADEVLTRVRLTYFDLLKARRELDTIEFIVDGSEKALQTTASLENQGAGHGHDVVSDTDELELKRLKKDAVERVKTAEQNMLRVLEQSSLTPHQLAKRSKEMDQILRDFDWQTMLASLRDSSMELQAARDLIEDQERLLNEATTQLWTLKALLPILIGVLPKVPAARLQFQEGLRPSLVFDAQEGDGGPSTGTGPVLIRPMKSP